MPVPPRTGVPHPARLGRDDAEMAKGLDLRQKLVIVVMDLLLLGELTFSIYYSHLDPENMTIIFLKTFLPLAAGTVLLSIILVRILRRSKEEKEEVPAEAVHGPNEYLN
jgi:hypothetical protein